MVIICHFISQSFGGYGSGLPGLGGGMGAAGRRASRNDDFMNKVRKRRESSADITVYRKGRTEAE